MSELNDHQLLAEFVQTKSEEAFATLVARHVNLVYSAALRFTDNPAQAEEITQAVFIVFAGKAGSLGKNIIISGWLYQTARLTAANFRKVELRRQRREQEAYMQSTLNEASSNAWDQIAPRLDEAMGELSEIDRNAIVLSFFENKTTREVAEALQLNEPAAHKRITRAVEKLRKFFMKRGVASTAAGIVGAISANSIQAAPLGLPSSIPAVAIGKGAVAGGSALLVANGTLKAMAWMKIKTALAIVTALLFATGTTAVIIEKRFPYTIRNSVTAVYGETTNVFGLTQVHRGGDGTSQPAMIGGKACQQLRVLPGYLGACNIYFKMDPVFKAKKTKNLKVTVEYFDAAPGDFHIEFDGTRGGAYAKSKETADLTGDQQWKTAMFTLENVRLEGRENSGADFRIRARGGHDFYFREVTVSRE